jgi:hypothetical protein
MSTTSLGVSDLYTTKVANKEMKMKKYGKPKPKPRPKPRPKKY